MRRPHTASNHVPMRPVFIITAQLWLTHSGKRLNMARPHAAHYVSDFGGPLILRHQSTPATLTITELTDFKILLPQRLPASRSRLQQAPSAALTAPWRIDELSAAADDNVESDNNSSRIFISCCCCFCPSHPKGEDSFMLLFDLSLSYWFYSACCTNANNFH